LLGNNTELTAQKAIISTTNGAEITKQEEELFREYRPAGFILFKRHCISKAQVKELVSSLREIVDVANLPILIDQEGGTVSRLKEPEWKEYPAAKTYGELAAKTSLYDARSAAYSMYGEIASDLVELGINVNCAPVLDLPSDKCHEFLRSRVYGSDVETISKIGISVCEAMLSKGVTPIIKHMPGHGRAEVDSHFGLPVTNASVDDLDKTDFATFRNVADSEFGDAVWAMSAHVMYTDIDGNNPATFSRKITEEIVRDKIGFNGVLLADCLSMRALNGSVEEKIKRTFDAGLDLAMLTNSLLDDGGITPISLNDMEAAFRASNNISEDTAQRLMQAEEKRIYYKEKE